MATSGPSQSSRVTRGHAQRFGTSRRAAAGEMPPRGSMMLRCDKSVTQSAQVGRTRAQRRQREGQTLWTLLGSGSEPLWEMLRASPRLALCISKAFHDMKIFSVLCGVSRCSPRVSGFVEKGDLKLLRTSHALTRMPFQLKVSFNCEVMAMHKAAWPLNIHPLSCLATSYRFYCAGLRGPTGACNPCPLPLL